jgi:hypothetical protein
MWKRVVRAKTKALFFEAWTKLCEEFTDQEAILQYLQFEYLSVHEQWAEYAIRHHLNYGQTTTSQSESSNHCIKTYLVSGKCDFYGLIKALREMVRNHKEDYKQKVAQSQARIRHTYVKQAYLGDLRLQLTGRALDLINDERVRALALVTDPAAPAVIRCDEHCTTWLQFKIPCAHTILEHIGDGDVRPLTVHDVDKRWISDSRVDENHPYLRIQDPPAAEDRRGRPKNHPIHPRNLPRELQILTHPSRTPRVQESQASPANGTPRGTPRRSQQPGSQLVRSLPRAPRARTGGRGGRRQATRRLARSTERIPSNFEAVLPEPQSSPAVRAAQTRRAPTTRRTTSRNVDTAAATRRTTSAGVLEEGAQVETTMEDESLRRTHSGRVRKPARKVAEKRRGEAYS